MNSNLHARRSLDFQFFGSRMLTILKHSRRRVPATLRLRRGCALPKKKESFLSQLSDGHTGVAAASQASHRSSRNQIWGAKHPGVWVGGQGSPGCDSDIDFLVEFDANRTLFDLMGLRLDLRDLLAVDVDVVTPDSLLYIRDKVLAEARAI